MMNPLLDSEFLIKLNNNKNRVIYAHIISLNQYEHPIEQLEGVVTAGSITIDGQSAVRRVCSLTLSAKNLNINNIYWGISTKVKIEIGLQNTIDNKYDDIIWFPQGIFILTDFKTTQTINNYTINLSGKDKMCLLNGDVSGNLPAPIRFDSYTDSTKQSYTLTLEDNGAYNNFMDVNADNVILAGFQERYGNDYQFIRSAKKILTLQYIPKDSIVGKIKFNINEDFTNISSIVSSNSDNKDNIYDIDITEKNIYGFVVEDCNIGDKFIWTIEQKIPIAIIIQELLHQFGQERYSNIIIRNIDPYALEMLDSEYEENHYLLHDGTTYTDFIGQEELINNYLIDGSHENITVDNETNLIDNIIFRNYIEEDNSSIVDILNGSTAALEKKEITKIYNKNEDIIKKYTITPIYNNEVAGYGMTLLVYPEELSGSPGDSITSILDKIVNMLGDYEYFYDLKGQFIFQAKPAYIKTAWNGTIYLNEENYIDPSELKDRVAYTFDDANLTTQYQNTPNMNNIKNDYIIWGEKKNLSGNTIKFHGRYAIENIPLEYTDFNGYTWTTNRQELMIKKFLEKKSQAISNYQHSFDYPSGYSPEESGWWEVNDWANYYQSVYNIDLSKNSTWLRDFHVDYGPGGLPQEAKDIFNNVFLTKYNYSSKLTSNTDVVSIIFDNSRKETATYIRTHGSCSHEYAFFMDLRKLGEGWDYAEINNKYDERVQIINTINPNKKYILENGKILSQGASPTHSISFIYRPMLPDNILSNNSTNLISFLSAIGINENKQKRQYAIKDDVDWRHLIAIMADDWYQHHTEDDYEINLRMNNSWPNLNINLFPYGKTYYEQYYLDLTSNGGFWQDLYDINIIKYQYYYTHKELREKDPLVWQLLQKKYEEASCEFDKFGSNNNIKYVKVGNYQCIKEPNYYYINLTVLDEESKNNLEEELALLKTYILEKNIESNEEDNSYLFILKISNKIVLDEIIPENNSLIYDIIIKGTVETGSPYKINIGKLYSYITIYNNKKDYFTSGEYKYWNKDVVYNPEKLNFWFDFFQADKMGIGKFAVSVIGDRPKTINDSTIKTIIYRDTPDVIYCSLNEYKYYERLKILKDGYIYIIVDGNGRGYKADEILKVQSLLQEKEKELSQLEEDRNIIGENEYLRKQQDIENKYNNLIPEYLLPQNFADDIKNNFIRSIRYRTVHQQAETMLYQYSYYNDSVNINNVPIYYLSPNTIISIKDELSKIIGYYVINKIDISLAYNGIMQIAAIKSPERIY